MYKLSNLAAEDFAGIYEYTLLKFGEVQADDYTEAMEDVLESVVRSPFIGREYPEIDEGVRRIDYCLHAIFYRIRDDDIFILRILHHKMEPLVNFSEL
ncbi:type II toxin-antitoxin system RelE/ParE family toxin [Buttiauxella noackiae]|uniref:type II toxin-antitoxin system RelE/ParE family toxin n=1 Tax=Buttiauxella noackiae TaxID=82992 RepID=UPI0023577EB9|nr:type II toxin-antitoxin system RelE/ParE family toxin [Buttiauxella noackiae]MCA1924197.1 type II toxin-antitoxin system RelE/ParE family toxin [Buttiauxella noackiae]